MKLNTLIIALVIAFASIGVASATYGISGGEAVTLDIGENHIFSITVTDSTTPNDLYVYIKDSSDVDSSAHFTLKVDTVPTAFGAATSWAGTDKTFSVELTNVNAPNGIYTLDVVNVNNVGSPTSLEASVESVVTGIPEFPTIALPVAAIIGLAFFMQRRKEE